jgi:hypothetical protein
MQYRSFISTCPNAPVNEPAQLALASHRNLIAGLVAAGRLGIMVLL